MGKYDQYICTELHKRHMLPGTDTRAAGCLGRRWSAHQHGTCPLDRQRYHSGGLLW